MDAAPGKVSCTAVKSSSERSSSKGLSTLEDFGLVEELVVTSTVLAGGSGVTGRGEEGVVVSGVLAWVEGI